MKTQQRNSLITFSGIAGFLISVVFLHIKQIPTGYDPATQLMSELALGKQGFVMLFAFLSLALASAGAECILRFNKAPLIMSVLLALAALSFAGAGYFKLGQATEIHISLVGFAFILLGLSMYLTPRLVHGFHSLKAYTICWGLCVGTALSVVLGQGILPMGIAQRLAAACILVWFFWLALFSRDAS